MSKIIILFIVLSVFYSGDESIYPKQVTSLPGKDSSFINPVYLDKNEHDQYYYHTTLRTSVCNDDLCQLVRLKLNWDLAGSYIGYDTLNGYPLTKNDHIPFTTQDYKKLHQALQDNRSILGDKSEEELFDKSKERYSEKIDGTTGATSLEVKKVVVDGALYSTYTLWKMANGEIVGKLKNKTKANLTQGISQQLLNSDNPEAVLLALDQWQDEDFITKSQQLINIMQRKSPLVNFYLAKRVPANVWQQKKTKKQLAKLWDELDSNTKSYLPIPE